MTLDIIRGNIHLFVLLPNYWADNAAQWNKLLMGSVTRLGIEIARLFLYILHLHSAVSRYVWWSYVADDDDLLNSLKNTNLSTY